MYELLILSHVWLWELDCKESWAPKNWCFWTVVLKKTLESPSDFMEIQPVHPKGDQSWVFFGRTDAKAETPVLWPPHAKSWLIGKDSDAGRDWGQEEKGMTEDEMAGWHHQLDGREFEWSPGVGDGQGGLACCTSWGRKESDTTEQLNWIELRSLVGNSPWIREELDMIKQTSTCHMFLIEDKAKSLGVQQADLTDYSMSQGKPLTLCFAPTACTCFSPFTSNPSLSPWREKTLTLFPDTICFSSWIKNSLIAH